MGSWGCRAVGNTCRAEEEDGGLAQLLVHLVGHRGLSLCQGGEDISVSLAHAGVDVVKEQREGAAPHGSHLWAQTGAAGIPGQQRAPGGWTGASGHGTAWGSSCLGSAKEIAAAHGATPSCQQLFALPGDKAGSSLCQPWALPSKFWGLAGPSPAPESPQLSVTITGTAHWPLGSPELVPLCSSRRGLHPVPAHGVGTGTTHTKHTCPLPGSSGMKEWPTVPA